MGRNVRKTLSLDIEVVEALEENEPEGEQSQKVEDLLREEYDIDE